MNAVVIPEIEPGIAMPGHLPIDDICVFVGIADEEGLLFFCYGAGLRHRSDRLQLSDYPNLVVRSKPIWSFWHYTD